MHVCVCRLFVCWSCVRVCSSVVNFILVLCNLSLHIMQCELLAIYAENNYPHTLCLLIDILCIMFLQIVCHHIRKRSVQIMYEYTYISTSIILLYVSNTQHHLFQLHVLTILA